MALTSNIRILGAPKNNQVGEKGGSQRCLNMSNVQIHFACLPIRFRPRTISTVKQYTPLTADWSVLTTVRLRREYPAVLVLEFER